MDRLSALASCSLWVLGACDGGGGPSNPVRSRVEAVAAKTSTAVDLDEFCEPRFTETAAPKFVYPPLAGTATPPGSGRARWINVWATWCKPCLDELPRIVEWQDRFGANLELLATDGDPAAVAAFAKGHPEVRGSLELADASAVQPWLTELGLPSASVLPIHLFVDAGDRLRCVRMAGLTERDEAAVAEVLASL